MILIRWRGGSTPLVPNDTIIWRGGVSSGGGGSNQVGGRSIYYQMMMRQAIEEDKQYRSVLNNRYFKNKKEALSDAINKAVTKQKEEWIEFITVEDEEFLMLD